MFFCFFWKKLTNYCIGISQRSDIPKQEIGDPLLSVNPPYKIATYIFVSFQPNQTFTLSVHIVCFPLQSFLTSALNFHNIVINFYLLEGVVGDFQLAAMRTFLQGAMGGSFYVFKRKLPRIARDKWIWTFLCSSCCKHSFICIQSCFSLMTIILELQFDENLMLN